MSKILVAFFSATGRTRDVAEKLSQYLAADLFEIRSFHRNHIPGKILTGGMPIPVLLVR